MRYVNGLAITALIICSIVLTHSAPSKVRYDQRQDGDLNVRADLENFVILVIPTATGTSPSTLNLLDLLAKAIPKRGHNKRKQNVRKPATADAPSSPLDGSGELDVQEETQSFIESKTAPYHVDISKSRKNLAKLHPNLPRAQVQSIASNGQEELLISPNLKLVKSVEDNEDLNNSDSEPQAHQERMLRISKGFVLSMPLEVEEDLVRIDNNKRIEKSKASQDDAAGKETEEIRTQKSAEPKLKLLLLGADHNEDCGPGYERDGNGVCKFLTHI